MNCNLPESKDTQLHVLVYLSESSIIYTQLIVFYHLSSVLILKPIVYLSGFSISKNGFLYHSPALLGAIDGL